MISINTSLNNYVYKRLQKKKGTEYTLLRFLGEYSSREGFLRLSLRIIRAAANAMMSSEQYFPEVKYFVEIFFGKLPSSRIAMFFLPLKVTLLLNFKALGHTRISHYLVL